jgi:hypothetical protein
MNYIAFDPRVAFPRGIVDETEGGAEKGDGDGGGGGELRGKGEGGGF